MTRIIAGTHGGRRLQVPPGTGTRPTSDRAREGLFSSLQTLTDLEGARVLDLYAGSGALGLEALSRGAAAATLVEHDPIALGVLQADGGARLDDRRQRCAVAAPQPNFMAGLGQIGGRGVAAVTSTQDCDFHERAPQLLGR